MTMILHAVGLAKLEADQQALVAGGQPPGLAAYLSNRAALRNTSTNAPVQAATHPSAAEPAPRRRTALQRLTGVAAILLMASHPLCAQSNEDLHSRSGL